MVVILSTFEHYRLVRVRLPPEVSESEVARWRIWQPVHGTGDQWAIDSLRIIPNDASSSIQADEQVIFN